jgi:hypothetical protein
MQRTCRPEGDQLRVIVNRAEGDILGALPVCDARQDGLVEVGREHVPALAGDRGRVSWPTRGGGRRQGSLISESGRHCSEAL